MSNPIKVKPFSKKDWILLGIGYAITLPLVGIFVYGMIQEGWVGWIFLAGFFIPLGYLVIRIMTSPYEPYVETTVSKPEEEPFDYSKMGARQ